MKNLKLSLIAAGATALMAISGPPASAGAQPYVGEIMMVGFNFCPRSWAEANGQLIAISQNTALFSLYGTMYGGDGRTTFGLPDLRGRVPMHAGNGPGLPAKKQGQKSGGGTLSFTKGQTRTLATNPVQVVRFCVNLYGTFPSRS